MTSETEGHFAARWQGFVALENMVDHWYWRPGWRVGRSFYTWHVTFAGEDGLYRLAAETQNALKPVNGLSIVPLQWLHLTMQGLGFVDELDESEVDRIVENARMRLTDVPSATIALGPVDADAEGIGLEVRPWAPLYDSRAAIRDAIADTWGPENVPESAAGFRPHVTLAYSATTQPTSAVRPHVEALRTVKPEQVHLRKVDLIQLNRDEKEYRWTERASLPLGVPQ